MLILFILVPMLRRPSESLVGQRRLHVLNLPATQLSHGRANETPLRHIGRPVQLKQQQQQR